MYAFGNRKGGTGKTLTVYHLARAASRAGRRVLVVDADPQGDITKLIAQGQDGERLPTDSIGLADVLMGEAQPEETLVPTLWAHVQLLPTVGAGLEVVRGHLAVAASTDHAEASTRLRQALQPLRARYDVVLIDCPPGIDQLTINALTAATGVVAVAEPRLLAADGLDAFRTTIDNVRPYNPDVRLLGVVINRLEAHTVSGRQWLDTIAQAVPLLHPAIPKRAPLADATEFGVGIDTWPGGAVSAELADLYDQLLTSIERAAA